MNPQMLMQLIQAMGQQRASMGAGGQSSMQGWQDPGIASGGGGGSPYNYPVFGGSNSAQMGGAEMPNSFSLPQQQPQAPQLSGGLFSMPQQQQQGGGYGGGMMDRMRQMQQGFGQGGYGQQGGYGGGWNDIVGNHMMQRQQMMNQPRQSSGGQRPQSPYQQQPQYPQQRRGWSSGFGGQPGVTPPGSVS
jgi:hypothetical protein